MIQTANGRAAIAANPRSDPAATLLALKAGSATADEIDDLLTVVEIEANPIRAATVVAASGQTLREDHATRIASLIDSPFDRRQQVALLDDLARDPALSEATFRMIGAAKGCLGASLEKGLIRRNGVRMACLAQHLSSPDDSSPAAIRTLFRWGGQPRSALRDAITRWPWLDQLLRPHRPAARRTIREALAETGAEIKRAGPAAILAGTAMIAATILALVVVQLRGAARTPTATLWDHLAASVQAKVGDKSPLAAAAWVITPFPGAESAELVVSNSVAAPVFGPAEVATRTSISDTAGGAAWLRRADLAGIPFGEKQPVIILSYHPLSGQIRAWDLDTRATIFSVAGRPPKAPTAYGDADADVLLARLERFFKGGGDAANPIVDRLLRAADAAANDPISTLRVKAAVAQVLQIRGGDLKDLPARLREITVLAREIDPRHLPEADRRWLDQVRLLPQSQPAETPAERWHAVLGVGEGVKK